MSFKRKAKRSKKPKVTTFKFTEDDREDLKLLHDVVERYRHVLTMRREAAETFSWCGEQMTELDLTLQNLGFSMANIDGLRSSLMNSTESESND